MIPTDALQRPGQAAAAMRRHVRTVAKVRLLDWEPEEPEEPEEGE
jgi:GntR family transcriptional repressor for pyruvate dehydrogenase complex